MGFSGDSPQHWDTLQVQVEMTPQASNVRGPTPPVNLSVATERRRPKRVSGQVLFGYWSHDVGGFHNGTVIKGFAKGYSYQGDEDPTNATQSELYLRW